MSHRPIAIVMAAGKSTRFKSQRSKLVHTVLGRPIIERVVEALQKLSLHHIYVVVSAQADDIRTVLRGKSVSFVVQEPQLGTGHSVQVAIKQISETKGSAIVINGDVPLLNPSLLKDVMMFHDREGADVTVVSAVLDDPQGYGRIVKRKRTLQIVEDRDATAAQKKIREVNAGLYLFSLAPLKQLIRQLDNQNSQKEYYLTDLIGIFGKAKKKIRVFRAPNPVEVSGVNDRVELARVERILRLRILERWMQDGVTILDPESTSIDDCAKIGPDTILYPGVRIEGHTEIGARCVVRSYSRLCNATLEDDVLVNDFSVINTSRVRSGATVGPFSHLRLEAEVEQEARVGNFVELKKARLGKGSKASHLTYLGDTEVGSNTNIGAGTITCNYDGVQKNKTVIEDNCFIGSGVELVAPVTVHQGAYVAAGSVITEEVPPNSLAIARGRQENKPEWRRKRGLKQGVPEEKAPAKKG